MMEFIAGCLLGLLVYSIVLVVHNVIAEIRFNRKLREIDKERKQVKSNINKIKNNFK